MGYLLNTQHTFLPDEACDEGGLERLPLEGKPMAYERVSACLPALHMKICLGD